MRTWSHPSALLRSSWNCIPALCLCIYRGRGRKSRRCTLSFWAQNIFVASDNEPVIILYFIVNRWFSVVVIVGDNLSRNSRSNKANIYALVGRRLCSVSIHIQECYMATRATRLCVTILIVSERSPVSIFFRSLPTNSAFFWASSNNWNNTSFFFLFAEKQHP